MLLSYVRHLLYVSVVRQLQPLQPGASQMVLSQLKAGTSPLQRCPIQPLPLKTRSIKSLTTTNAMLARAAGPLGHRVGRAIASGVLPPASAYRT